MMVSGVGTKHYFHQNHLYSVAAMTNSVGAVVERYRYDAYGKRTVTNAAGTTIAASTIGQQRGFTGYYLDAEIGLYFARSRTYSSGLGRFIGRDELGYLDGASLYNSYFVPNRVDPFGFSAKCAIVDSGSRDFDEKGKTKNFMIGPVPVTIGFDAVIQWKYSKYDCKECCGDGREAEYKYDEIAVFAKLTGNAGVGFQWATGTGAWDLYAWVGLLLEGSGSAGGSLKFLTSGQPCSWSGTGACLSGVLAIQIKGGGEGTASAWGWSATIGVQAYGGAKSTFEMCFDKNGKITSYSIGAITGFVGVKACFGVCASTEWTIS